MMGPVAGGGGGTHTVGGCLEIQVWALIGPGLKLVGKLSLYLACSQGLCWREMRLKPCLLGQVKQEMNTGFRKAARLKALGMLKEDKGPENAWGYS